MTCNTEQSLAGNVQEGCGDAWDYRIITPIYSLKTLFKNISSPFNDFAKLFSIFSRLMLYRSRSYRNKTKQDVTKKGSQYPLIKWNRYQMHPKHINISRYLIDNFAMHMVCM